MSENLHDIDQLFRDGLEGHEDMPPEKVWDAVDAGLDKSNVISINRKYNNLKRVAAVLLLLLLSVVGYEVFKTKLPANESAGNDKAEPVNTVSNSGEANNSGTAAVKNGATGTATNNNTSLTGNSTQSNTVTNAGYDSLNTATAPFDNTASKDKRNSNGQPVENKQVADNSRVNTTAENTTTPRRKKQGGRLTAAAANNVVDDEAADNKTAGNRSFHAKTRIKIRSAVPRQAEDENIAGDESSQDNSTAAVKQLPPLENTKISTLAERINKAIDDNENRVAVNRQSPNVVVKKMRGSRTFHFSVMPYFSPQFAFSSMKEENHSSWQTYSPGGPPPPRPGDQDHKEQYKKEEQEQRSYSAGIIVEVPLGKNWNVQSGITYLNKSTSIEPKKIYARTDKDGKVKYVFDCSSGYSYISTKTGTTPRVGDSINATASKNVLGYIGVPLTASYKFSLGKFSIMPTVGTMLNFLTKQKIETALVQGTTKEPQTISNIEGLKKSYMNAVTGVAVEYNVNKRVAINIMPSGSFALTSITKDAAVKSYPNAFGVAGGLKIKF